MIQPVRFGQKILIRGSNRVKEERHARHTAAEFREQGIIAQVVTNQKNWFVFTEKDAKRYNIQKQFKTTYDAAQNDAAEMAFLERLDSFKQYPGFEARYQSYLRSSPLLQSVDLPKNQDLAVKNVARQILLNIRHEENNWDRGAEVYFTA